MELPDDVALAMGRELAGVIDQLLRGSHPPLVYQMLGALNAMKAAAPFMPASQFYKAGQFGHLDVATLEALLAQVTPPREPSIP
jgi:hypothetical protein